MAPTDKPVVLTSKESHVASDRETVRCLSGDLALARNCLSNLLFAESALDKELARREARRFLGHPPTDRAHETRASQYTETQIREFCEYLTGYLTELGQTHPGSVWDGWESYLRRSSQKANVVVVGPTCGKDTPDGPCRSDIGHEGDCDGLPY